MGPKGAIKLIESHPDLYLSRGTTKFFVLREDMVHRLKALKDCASIIFGIIRHYESSFSYISRKKHYKHNFTGLYACA